MQHTKEVIKPAKAETVIEKTTCDLCGRAQRGGWRDWGGGDGNVYETEVKLEDGYGYPDGGNVKTTEFDICPECPWLESQGARPRIEETDF